MIHPEETPWNFNRHVALNLPQRGLHTLNQSPLLNDFLLVGGSWVAVFLSYLRLSHGHGCGYQFHFRLGFLPDVFENKLQHPFLPFVILVDNLVLSGHHNTLLSLAEEIPKSDFHRPEVHRGVSVPDINA